MSKYFDIDWRTLMSVEQDKKIQSLYASLKNVMAQNLDKDEQEQLLEWMHTLILDTSKERKFQKINGLLKSLDTKKSKQYEELAQKKELVRHKNYPTNLKIGDIVSVKYGFGYCSEISNTHYGIVFSEYIAGLYLILPLSSEPLKKKILYLDNLNLPNKDGIKNKRSYIQLNHAKFMYYRRLEKIKGRGTINIGSEEIKRISKEFIDFLNLPIDTDNN